MQEDRIRYIDVYQGLGIILVVLGNIRILPENYRIWVGAFGMLLFFVAAGLTTGERRLYEKDSSMIVKYRFVETMLPYFWISLLIVFAGCLTRFLMPLQFDKEGMLDQIWDFLSLYGGSQLWFLPVFFFGVTGYQLLRKKIDYPILLALTAILAAVICGINGIPVYTAGRRMSVEVFFLQAVYAIWRGCVGMFFCAVGEGMGMLFQYLKQKKMVMSLTGLLLTVLGSYLALKNGKGLGAPCSFQYLITGEMILFFISAVCICCGILLLCRWIGECRPLEYAGRSFIIILATYLDLKVVDLAEWVGDRIFLLLDHNFVCNITILTCVLGAEFLIIRMFNHILNIRSGQKKLHMTGHVQNKNFKKE